jgi:methylthioribulose-1-phosphate dehydratase
MPPDPDYSRQLVDIGRQFHARGWVFGTSGNLSAVIQPEPLRLAITVSGADKGALVPEQILEVGPDGEVLRGAGRPSDETRLHLAVIRTRKAGAVLHTHSVWSTILSQANAADGALTLAGYEMLKGLSGVKTHDHRELLPIFENSQDLAALSAVVAERLANDPLPHGFLLRGHGLYTWGRDLAEARRHVEILEFLLEVAGRTEERGGK